MLIVEEMSADIARPHLPVRLDARGDRTHAHAEPPFTSARWGRQDARRQEWPWGGISAEPNAL